MTVQEILYSNDPQLIKALFLFTPSDDNEKIWLKFQLYIRFFQPQYFKSVDAPFHKQMDLNYIKLYKGEIKQFVNIAFKGAAKTARQKLFVAFCIANDATRTRRYIKVLSDDGTNSTQIVTDIYNIFIQEQHKKIYPEIFTKTDTKREETMSSFTTATGVKFLADTLGTAQRGALQEDARPDWVWFEDFETRKTLRSAKVTQGIWDNMEEARTGLSKEGVCVYTCNYISEMGNVHKLVTKESTQKVVMITPILDKEGNSTWDRYSKEEIGQMRIDDDDFEGERMCRPSAAKDIFFDREMLEKQVKKAPIRELAGFKIFKAYNPAHRYASGHDVAGGLGLDSSTSVFIDFDPIPCQVVATFKSNLIKPDIFGDEIVRESDIFGSSLICPEENNHGHTTIFRAKQLGGNVHRNDDRDGWNTNAVSKPKMLFDFAKAVQNGHIELSDPDLIQEVMSYTRNDIMDTQRDPRLTTRHFDLLMAAAIAYQMKDFAQVKKTEYVETQEERPLYDDIGV